MDVKNEIHAPAPTPDSSPAEHRGHFLASQSAYKTFFKGNLSRQHCVVFMVIISTLVSLPCACASEIFTDCGGFLEESRGVVQSPGFPGPFPAPLSCRWVIHAEPEKKIVLYFTQYFLRGAFYVTEYLQYTNEHEHMGRNQLGQINFEDDIRTLVAYQPYLVLDFHLHETTNIHLRVEEYLQDVFGFNITYEIVDRDEGVRQDTCSVNDCSFLGHCLASANFSQYRCSCFPGFFGKECQYGPFCDPDKGINMCINGGRCRYFYGSMINVCECPPGFVGPKCEEKEDSLSEECAKLGCSDHCKRQYDGSLQCACQDGFKLDTDNVTCIEQELYRVTVSVPVIMMPQPQQWNEQRAYKQAIVILQQSGLSTVKRFAVDGMNFTDDSHFLVFHFYVDHSELELVGEGVGNLMWGNHLFNFTVNADNRTMQVDPEMKLLSIDNYESPALEGKSLIVQCTARGSPNLRFRWFKDGHLFNASLTSRNAWVVHIEDEIDKKQVSVFNIDGVTTYDKGEFACEIEDFGQKERKSVRVDVMPLPQVEVRPLTASLLPGESQSFRCLSPDENMRTFSYEWLRNGEQLGEPVNGEVVEDLMPSGSRLYLTGVTLSANYTCRVLNKAGSSEKEIFVFVVSANMSAQVCENSAYDGVKWNRTFGGYFDLQKCPIDTADFKIMGRGDGYARRDCVCDEKCQWGGPNYARCHSVLLSRAYEQLERLQLGYQQSGLSSVYDQLYDMVQKAETLAGDVDMFAINLHILLDVTLRYPALAPSPTDSYFSLETVAHFMNILLKQVKNTNEFEKRDLSVGARLIRVCEIMVDLVKRHPELLHLHNVTMPRIQFALLNVTLRSLNFTYGSHNQPEVSLTSFPGRRLMSVSEDDVDEKTETSVAYDETREVLQVTFDRDIIPITPVVDNERPSIQMFITPMISVLPLHINDFVGRYDYSNNGDDGRGEERGVEIEFPHITEKPVFVENTTKCLSWSRRDSSHLVGTWSESTCHVTYRAVNVTRCLCPVPGHYAVVVIPVNTSAPEVTDVQSDTVMLVGCIVALCGLTVAVLIYFIIWRHVAGDTSVIHVNLVLALAGVNVVCILCLSQSGQTICVIGKILLHFFQLTTFSFLLMEAIHTYVRISYIGGASRIQYSCARYFLIGWGIPSVATLAVVLLSKIGTFDDTCRSWCWWSVDQWQYYSFIVPLVVLIVSQVGVMSTCLVCMRMWKDEWRFRERTKHIFTAVRSFVLQFFLVIFCVSGVLSEVKPTIDRQFFFAIVNILLVLAVVISLIVLRPRMRIALYTTFCPGASQKRSASSSSFRAFVQPGRVEDSDEMEVRRIQEYCTKLDRSKYTSERKQQLRFLLGSSSSGSSTSGVGSSPSTAQSSFEPLPGGIHRTSSGRTRSEEIGRFSDINRGQTAPSWRREVKGRRQGASGRRAGGGGTSPNRSCLRNGEVGERGGGDDGAHARRHHPHPCIQNPSFFLVPAQPQCRDSNPQDSGISEGTESDKSFHQGHAAYDLDSQLSSDIDAEPLGDTDSNNLSLSVSPVRGEFGQGHRDHEDHLEGRDDHRNVYRVQADVGNGVRNSDTARQFEDPKGFHHDCGNSRGVEDPGGHFSNCDPSRGLEDRLRNCDNSRGIGDQPARSKLFTDREDNYLSFDRHRLNVEAQQRNQDPSHDHESLNTDQKDHQHRDHYDHHYDRNDQHNHCRNHEQNLRDRDNLKDHDHLHQNLSPKISSVSGAAPVNITNKFDLNSNGMRLNLEGAGPIGDCENLSERGPYRDSEASPSRRGVFVIDVPDRVGASGVSSSVPQVSRGEGSSEERESLLGKEDCEEAEREDDKLL